MELFCIEVVIYSTDIHHHPDTGMNVSMETDLIMVTTGMIGIDIITIEIDIWIKGDRGN